MTHSESSSESSSPVENRLARHGGLSYLEIPALDIPKSALFYRQVLGWNVNNAETDHAKFTDASGHLIGRWVVSRPIAREPGLLAYFYVNQIHDAVDRALNHAGEIVRVPYREGNLWVATLRDPAGNLIGIWQDGS